MRALVAEFQTRPPVTFPGNGRLRTPGTVQTRLLVSAEQQVQPAVGRDSRHQVPGLALDGVLHGPGLLAVVGVPAGGRGVQVRDDVRVVPLELGLEDLGEQAV
jgi:hypothetical protein